jgi:hypothetical protein
MLRMMRTLTVSMNALLAHFQMSLLSLLQLSHHLVQLPHWPQCIIITMINLIMMNHPIMMNIHY